MLVTSIFSFSHSAFCSIKEKIVILATFTLSSANAFSLFKSKNLSFGKWLKAAKSFNRLTCVDSFRKCIKLLLHSAWFICFSHFFRLRRHNHQPPSPANKKAPTFLPKFLQPIFLFVKLRKNLRSYLDTYILV